jgi:peptide/nickel transport system ATP-binding protein
MTEPILAVRNLTTSFVTDRGAVRALDGVSFSVGMGRTVGLVGESGCGKSVTSLSIMGLIPMPPGRIDSGEIMFEGRDVLRLNRDARRALRGHEMAMIFQEPMTSLNPVHTIGHQIVEAIRAHGTLSATAARPPQHCQVLLIRQRLANLGPAPTRYLTISRH